jgi:hypothetical protein
MIRALGPTEVDTVNTLFSRRVPSQIDCGVTSAVRATGPSREQSQSRFPWNGLVEVFTVLPIWRGQN